MARKRLTSRVLGLRNPNEPGSKARSFGPDDVLPEWAVEQIDPSRLVDDDRYDLAESEGVASRLAPSPGQTTQATETVIPPAQSEPSPAEQPPAGDVADDYEDMNRDDLVSLAQAREIPGINTRTTKPEAIEALRAHDAAGTVEQ